MMRNVHRTKTATIADEASLSDEIVIEGYRLAWINVPSGWIAADITFQGKLTNDGTLANIYEDSSDTEVTVQAAESRLIALATDKLATFKGLYSIKVRSGTAGSAVNQTAGPMLLTLGLVAD